MSNQIVQALSDVPSSLRDPLLEEYQRIVQNYLERKWLPAELSGGRFCEIVWTILHGHQSGTYAATPSKPQNFVQACRDLENGGGGPRSFRILIPRMLPALYEIRNNRGVGHVGGDVDPNHMDATAVVASANWIMAELVRVFHDLSAADAQNVVDQLAERQIPIIWQVGEMKRVLKYNLKLDDQTLLLVASCASSCSVADLLKWLDYENQSYFRRVLKSLHDRRMIEFNQNDDSVQILPPGTREVETLVALHRI